jgi:hypothetical protein
MAEVPIVCTLTTLEERARQAAGIAQLVRGAASREVHETGVVLRFEAHAGLLAEIARVLEVERVCCQYLRFAIAVAPAHGSITLEISGPPDALSAVEHIWNSSPEI